MHITARGSVTLLVPVVPVKVKARKYIGEFNRIYMPLHAGTIINVK